MHFALYEANEENSDALIKTVDILVGSFVVRHPSFYFSHVNKIAAVSE